LHIDTNRGHITTSTGDELFKGINIDDLKQHLTSEIQSLVLFAIFDCCWHFRSKLRRNGWK